MMIGQFLLLGLILFLSAVSSAAEAAFISLTPGEIQAMAENKGRNGLRVKKLSEKSDVLLATLLLGNNLANLGASAMVAALTIKFLGNGYIAVATGGLTLIVLVFCEIIPKQVAIAKNEYISLVCAPVIILLSWILHPFIWVIGIISRMMTKVIAVQVKSSLTPELILHQVKAAETEGVVESFEKEMIRNVLRISDTPVEAIMTHRTELFTVEEDSSIQSALDGLLKSGFTRAPVLKARTEHVSGIVTLASLASKIRDSPEIPVKRIAESPEFVPGTLKVHELYFRLKKEPLILAVVLDEYGGLDGIVTHRDIMEEIFGELYDDDKTQSVDDPILPDGRGAWIIQGDADFYSINDILGLKLDHDNRTHTVGGYLLEKMGNIPEAGAEIMLPEGYYIILATEKKRIQSVYFRPAGEIST